jgi:ClpP class serine protease
MQGEATMTKKLPNKVLNAIFTGKWAIETNHLDLLIGIASREISDMQAVLAMPLERRESGTLKMRDGVAVINAFGPIFPRADMFTDISGATSVDTLALRFGEALNAPDVKAIVLNIDSPGGNVVGVNEFAKMIYGARGKKPIIAYTGGLCASAAYWIASAADKIVTDETAFLGSIGVVAAWTDDSEARKKDGLIDYVVVSSQSPDKRQDLNSEDGRAKLQAELDALADVFIGTVARHRGARATTVQEKYGKGGVLISDEAVKVGMADMVGSLEGVITRLSNESYAPKVSVKKKKKESINIITTQKGVSVMAKAKTEEDEDKKKKASEDEDEEMEDEEDEDEDEEASTSKKKSALKSKDPSLYNAIKADGVTEERARIQAIDEIRESVGYSDLVRKAMFDKPISAAELALRIVRADKEAVKKAAEERSEDAKAVTGIPVSGYENNQTKTAAILDSMVSGIKARGGREVVKNG